MNLFVMYREILLAPIFDFKAANIETNLYQDFFAKRRTLTIGLSRQNYCDKKTTHDGGIRRSTFNMANEYLIIKRSLKRKHNALFQARNDLSVSFHDAYVSIRCYQQVIVVTI